MLPSQSERPGNLLACPQCLSPNWLGENVTGWRELKKGYPRMVDGEVVARGDGSVNDAEHRSFFCSNKGCNVDEEIPACDLIQIDDEGNVIGVQPAEQGRLA